MKMLKKKGKANKYLSVAVRLSIVLITAIVSEKSIQSQIAVS